MGVNEDQREQRWRMRYENSVKAMTEHYEFINERLFVSEYNGINSEQDYENLRSLSLSVSRRRIVHGQRFDT